MEHDISEIAALLHIHREAVQHGDAMANVAAGTYARLKQINAKWGEQLTKERAAAKEEAAARAEKEAQVRAKEQAEAEKATVEPGKASAEEPKAKASEEPPAPSVPRREIASEGAANGT